jgi:hypothetical protein
MSALSLDDLRKGADGKYPDFEIELEDGKILGFKPVLRLPKEKRRAVADALDLKKRLEALPEDHDVDQAELMIAVLSDALHAAERTRGDFNKLAKWAGMDDLGMWLFLFEQYSEVTDPGGASPSES